MKKLGLIVADTGSLLPYHSNIDPVEVAPHKRVDRSAGRGDEAVVEVEQREIPGGELEASPSAAPVIRVTSESSRNRDRARSKSSQSVRLRPRGCRGGTPPA